MSIMVELSMFPIGKGESVSPWVARAVRIIQGSGLACELGPMGTTLEGEWDEVMEVVRRCHDALRADCGRVYMTLKIDSREGPGGRLGAKVRAVEDRLDEE